MLVDAPPATLLYTLQAVYILLAEANERRPGNGNSKATGSKPVLPGAPVMEPVLAPRCVPVAQGAVYNVVSSSGADAHHGKAVAAEAGAVLIAAPHEDEDQPLLVHSKPSSAAAVPLFPGLSSTAEVLYYAAASTMPVFAVAVAVALWGGPPRSSAEVPASEGGSLSDVVGQLPQRLGSGFWPRLVMTAWTETALAGTLVWCTERNGGLATSIVGVLKGVAAVVLGLVFMAGPTAGSVTPMNLAGIAMVLIGGSWYSSLQCVDKGNPKP